MQQTNSTYPFYGPEDIKRYLSGSMSAQEMHDMEKAALKDPLLADAIDGFRNADPVVTDAHLNAIKASILGLSQQEKPMVVPLNPSPQKSWWRWVAAACSLTLIAGTTWWITQKAESGVKPVAIVEEIQPADTSLAAVIPPPTAVNAASEPNPVAADQSKKPHHLTSELKKEPVASTKVLKAAEVMQALAPKAATGDEAIFNGKEAFPSEPKALRRDQVSDDYVSSMVAASVPPATPMAKNRNMQAPGKITGFQPVAYIEGQVVDQEGTPLPNASISIPGRNKTTANNDGSFVLPVYDSSFNVAIGMVGYQNRTAFLQPGKQNKIVLDKAFNYADEITVTAMAKQKKTAAYMADARKAQAAAVSANEVIYPEEGWSHFYEELGTNLGVDKAKKTKTLQIKFTVDDNGDPVDFEVVESPDAIMARKAIEFIKKAKWKNFKLDKNALVKIEVN